MPEKRAAYSPDLEMDGFISLEEIDDPSVTPVKKAAKAKARPAKKKQKHRPLVLAPPVDLDWSPEVSNREMVGWLPYELDDSVLRGLHALGFKDPTEIQEHTLVHAMQHRKDVFGAAKTGSGKTLAYGVPILHRLASAGASRQGIAALVVVPTRELGIQVALQLKQAAAYVEPRVRIVSIVGGLSVQKQERQLSSSPDVVVATPGRLWELLGKSQHPGFIDGLRLLSFLVLDEADRMVEEGHFLELQNILQTVYAVTASPPKKIPFQTLLFSATLANSTQRGGSNSMDALTERLTLRSGTPAKIDLITQNQAITPSTLSEFRVNCLSKEKDYVLAAILLKYRYNPEQKDNRILVFVNSIDLIRRLVPLLRCLGYGQVSALHSQMQQRQRLVNIDRFKGAAGAILVASDVAARGIDVASIGLVIHYQVPRSKELYVHRSGRTARANALGTCVTLVSEEEFTEMKKILSQLTGVADLPPYPVSANLISRLKVLVNLAREVEQLEHRLNKDKFDNRWMSETADVLGVAVDEHLVSDISDESETRSTIKRLKKRLEGMRLQIEKEAVRFF